MHKKCLTIIVAFWEYMRLVRETSILVAEQIIEWYNGLHINVNDIYVIN